MGGGAGLVDESVFTVQRLVPQVAVIDIGLLHCGSVDVTLVPVVEHRRGDGGGSLAAPRLDPAGELLPAIADLGEARPQRAQPAARIIRRAEPRIGQSCDTLANLFDRDEDRHATLLLTPAPEAGKSGK